MTVLRLERRRLGPLDRDVHLRERGDVLADAVFEDLEVLFLQVRDELAVAVEHRGVDLDVIDGHLEGDGGLVGRCGRRLLSRERGDGRERNHRSTSESAHEHDGVIPSLHWQP